VPAVKSLIAVSAIFFAFAAPAHAGLTVQTSTTQAGAPADVTLDATFATTPSSVAVHLPAGLVGNPNAAAKCPLATFRNGTCAGDTRVGDASARSGLLTLNGGVYNLAPEPGEPARLGIAIELLNVIPLVRNEAAISLRPDGGLDSTIAQLETGGLSINELSLTLNRTFMTLPSRSTPTVPSSRRPAARTSPSRPPSPPSSTTPSAPRRAAPRSR
jgi:hypothetical protein